MAKKRTKRSTEETLARRQEVYKLRMRGLSLSAMATVLGVHVSVISDDVLWMKNHLSEVASTTDRFEAVGDAMRFFEEIEKESMFQFHDATTAREKRDFLQTAMTARRNKLQIMMETGIVQKTAEVIEIKALREMSTEQLLERKVALENKLRLLGDGRRTIDMEEVVDQVDEFGEAG